MKSFQIVKTSFQIVISRLNHQSPASSQCFVHGIGQLSSASRLPGSQARPLSPSAPDKDIDNDKY